MTEVLSFAAGIFADLVERKFRFLLLVFGSAILMILYGTGLTWGSAFTCLGLLIVLGLFWGLTWFWLRFFRGLIHQDREDL